MAHQPNLKRETHLDLGMRAVLSHALENWRDAVQSNQRQISNLMHNNNNNEEGELVINLEPQSYQNAF